MSEPHLTSEDHLAAETGTTRTASTDARSDAAAPLPGTAATSGPASHRSKLIERVHDEGDPRIYEAALDGYPRE